MNLLRDSFQRAFQLINVVVSVFLKTNVRSPAMHDSGRLPCDCAGDPCRMMAVFSHP